MDAERARTLLLRLPHAVETMQWGANLVFWVGDKAIGGKMFAVMDLDGRGGPVIAFATEPERAATLREMQGLVPAPYFARIGWLAAERWDALDARAWNETLEAAHAVVLGQLTRRTQPVLALADKERRALIVERRRVLAKKATQGADPLRK